VLAWLTASNDGTDVAVAIGRAARIAALYDEIVIVADAAAGPADDLGAGANSQLTPRLAAAAGLTETAVME
jgi:hypothetical protein